ncbi:MAG: fasciclin domain-containing protein [Spirochaetaceae bacterium]|nr:fasciclin domain-containing protein [Spirochaetaceae bacterium]MDT8297708.1 fasciclin domain-containing protein [Spirochaetaceae bacterium]
MSKIIRLSVILLVVMTAAAFARVSEEMMAEEDMASSPSIAEIAVDDGRFTTLVAALVDAADLVETLSNDGEFTVFAPTDDAFAKLPEGTIDALLNDIPALTDILHYHVVSGEVYAETVLTLNGKSVETLSGDSVVVKIDMGNVYINDAQVVMTDIAASNGVIHVVDTVILPTA